MITKTYLDGKLNQLEEILRRRIEIRESTQTEEINKKISDLKDTMNLINERVIENKDILENYLVEHNGLKARIEMLELMFEKSTKDNDRSSGKNNINNSEQITDDLQ